MMSRCGLKHKPNRVTVILGAYGSGKSEVSVNYAIWLRKQQHDVTLCDLDTINPFFRSADARMLVNEQGIRLIAPVFAGTNVDVPAVPAEIQSVFDDRSRYAVLDIGGEAMGARVVASFKNRLAELQPSPDVWMVVNPYRPFTRTIEQIVEQADVLVQSAGLPLTGLIHNANLLENSDGYILSESYSTVAGAAERLKQPIVFAAALNEHVPAGWGDCTPEGVPLLRMRRTIHYRV